MKLSLKYFYFDNNMAITNKKENNFINKKITKITVTTVIKFN